MKTRRVQGQNEHNSENHDVLEDILCEIYCLGLHKRLNNSRHRVHWLASKSDRLSLGKVQGRKLPILMQDIFDLYSFVKSAYCCISVVIKFHSCGGLLEMVNFSSSLVYFLGGPRVSIYSGQSGNAFYAALWFTWYIWLLKTITEWMGNWSQSVLHGNGVLVEIP